MFRIAADMSQNAEFLLYFCFASLVWTRPKQFFKNYVDINLQQLWQVTNYENARTLPWIKFSTVRAGYRDYQAPF